MNYDITFCSKKDCSNKECERNQSNVDKVEVMIRQGISISNFEKCECWKEE